MNAARRKEIELAEKVLGKLKEIATSLRATIEDIKSDEEEAKEALPDSMQQGDKGEAMDTAISNLDSANEQIDDIISSVDEALRYTEAARE